jgi:hypothetical protein
MAVAKAAMAAALLFLSTGASSLGIMERGAAAATLNAVRALAVGGAKAEVHATTAARRRVTIWNVFILFINSVS